MKLDLPLLKNLDNEVIRIPGMEMTGPLTFNKGSENEVTEMDLVTRGEVKETAKNLDASNVTSPLSKDRFGPLTGDVSYDKTTGNINLVNTGVVSDVYVKVQVDAKGRVVSGSKTLSIDDIDNVSYNKLTNVPTDLAGWGVDDVYRTNDVMSSDIQMSGHPTEDDQVATRGYFNSVAGSGNGGSDGDSENAPGRIIGVYGDGSVDGYLRANGAIVQSAMYPELYELMGSPYWLDIVGGGKPWKNQYDFNEATAIGAWVLDADLPINNHSHQCVVTKNRLYMIGGLSSGSSYSIQVYYAPINEDGSLGTWVQDTNLPINNSHHQCVVTKNRLYMIGGISGGRHNQVYYAPINEDGSLGAWVKDTNLPINNSHHQCVVTKNRLYMIGGYSSSSHHNQVYYAPINEDGSLGAWVKDADLPINNGHFQCVVTKNRLYMIGGISSSHHNQVYYAPINEDGSLGTWVQDTNLPINNSHHQCVVTKNRLYMIGGSSSGSSYRIQVYYAPLTIPAGKEGGKNDYSEFYNPVVTYDKFALPNISDPDDKKTYYVKY